MNAPLDESTKRALEAVAKLLEGEKTERVIAFVYQMGYLDGPLKMATSQASRVDSAMRKML